MRKGKKKEKFNVVHGSGQRANKSKLFSVSLALSCTTCTIHAQFSQYRHNITQQQHISITSLCIVWFIISFLFTPFIAIRSFASRSNACNPFNFNFNSVYFRYSSNLLLFSSTIQLFFRCYEQIRSASIVEVIG